MSALFDNLTSVSSTKGTVGDWQHAARLYIDGNMRLAPKVKYLYHVVLNINSGADISALGNNQKYEINLLAKSSELPKYRVDTAVLNQYNRKKILQTGVEYQPLQIEFHDDNSGLTTLLWESYFRYYYADSEYTNNVGSSPSISIDAYNRIEQGKNRVYGGSSQNNFRYGLDKQGKLEPFFSSIQIFQLHPQNGKSTFTSFTLINPIIVSFDHDQMDHSISEFVLNRLTLQYESVQYGRGYTQVGTNPSGFAGDRLYDSTPSNLTLGDNISANRPVQGSDNSETAFRRSGQNNNVSLSTLEIQRQGQFTTPTTPTEPNVQTNNGFVLPTSQSQSNSTEAKPSSLNTQSQKSNGTINGYVNSEAERTTAWQQLYEDELRSMPGYPDNVKRSLQSRAKQKAHLSLKKGILNGSIEPPEGVTVTRASD